jgi:hypothetical protein
MDTDSDKKNKKGLKQNGKKQETKRLGKGKAPLRIGN